jgi:class 3 adenylate cyclase
MENLKKFASFGQAVKLGEFWHNAQEEGSLPENLKERISFAMNLSKKEMPDHSRKTISMLIREFVPYGWKFVDQKELENLLTQFEKGEIALSEILDYELEQIESNDELAPVIKQRLGDINQMIYSVLKGTLDGNLRADALTSLDLVIDNNRNQDFETAIKSIFERIELNLENLSDLKEVRLAHINPDPDISEYVVYNNLNSEKEEKAEILEYTNFGTLEWQEKKYSDLEVSWAKVSFPEENESRFVFKLNFGEQEFGYLEYRFEGESIHQIAFDNCANMSAMMDTFLNARLQIEIKKLIEAKKREILADHKFKDWTGMCTELCKALSKVLKTPIAFSCALKPGIKKSWDVLVNEGEVEEEADFVRFTKEAIDEGGEFFDLNIDEGKGRQRIGSLMVACKDDAQRGIVNDALSFLEGIIMGREEARHWLSKLIGAPAADKYLDNNIELTPAPHPVVTLFSDIDGYTKSVRKLLEKKEGIDRIMSEFIARAKLEIERDYDVIIDKFVGDEAITLIGPPYDKEGLDMFGNKEPNHAQYIDLAYDVAKKLQWILDDISEEFQERDNFKLPNRLVFANGCGIIDGDPVGIYGAPEEPGAGVDYTIFGNEMNRVARVLGQADAYEFLMPYASYEKYVEAGGTRLQPVKEAFDVDTKGLEEFKVILVTDLSNPLDDR